MSLNKPQLREMFRKDWKKHYQIDSLVSKGFERKQCSKCQNFFWTLDSKRTVCADSGCVGYQFIGKPTKKYSYTETWDEIAKFFKKNGHTEINRFPVVSRWRDDLYFTNASIIDFQPYVVSGEVQPPANPLIVPQTCLRFGDLANVGLTGRHYTCFVMFGQHAFNSGKKLAYWKDQALEYDYQYVTKVLGAKKEDLVFQEDVWVGGGNFGPSMEYFVGGLELGNCVFMQYQDLGDGKFEELNTRVIDMGAGLERLAWFTNGTPTSYEITYGSVIDYLKKQTGVKVDNALFQKYAKLSGLLDAERQNLKQERELIAKQLHVNEKELFDSLKKVQALYAIADHLKTILYTTTDGMLPSNSGGGYNLRLVLRRVFGFNEEFSFNLDYAKILELHAKELKGFDDTVQETTREAAEVVAEEFQQFKQTSERGKKLVVAAMDRAKSAGKKIETRDLVKWYQSDGIPIEVVQEVATQQYYHLEVPEDFYANVAQQNEVHKTKAKEFDISEFPPTQTLYYEDEYRREFSAKVLGRIDNYIVLDQSAFYPEGGGQEGDYGWLDGIEVLDTQKQNNVILHEVKNPERFKKGLKVFGKIDWNRRYALMKHHTGAHLLNAACRAVFGKHAWQSGAHKGAERAHLDITHYRRITPEQLRQLENRVNEFVGQGIPVKKSFLDRTKAEQLHGFTLYQGGFVPGKLLHIVEVHGTDTEACGGTHLNNTSEIGLFKILKSEGIQDGVERIHYACSVAALKQVQEKELLLKRSAEALSVPENQLPETAQRFFNEWKSQKKEIELYQSKMAELILERLLQREQNYFISHHFDDVSPQVVLSLAQKAVLQKPQLTAVLTCGNEPIEVTIAAGLETHRNAVDLLQELIQFAGGAGGGSPKIARGKIHSLERARKWMESLSTKR